MTIFHRNYSHVINNFERKRLIQKERKVRTGFLILQTVFFSFEICMPVVIVKKWQKNNGKIIEFGIKKIPNQPIFGFEIYYTEFRIITCKVEWIISLIHAQSNVSLNNGIVGQWC